MPKLDKIIEYGSYLLVFLLPLQTRWIIRQGGNEYSTLALYGVDILLALILTFYLVYKFSIFPAIGTPLRGGNFQFSIKSQTSNLKLTNKFPISNSKFQPLFYLIIGLNLVSLISIFFATDKLIAAQAWGRLTLGMGLFWLILDINFDNLKLVWSFLSGVSLQAGLGIWQFIAQTSFASKWFGLAKHPPYAPGTSVVETLSGERWLRAYGGQDHPNVFGGLLVIAILLSFFYLIENIKVTHKVQGTRYKILTFRNVLVVVSCFLFLPALFFTFSRGAWAALIVGALTMLIFYFWQKNFAALKTLLKLLAVGAIVAAMLFFNFQDLVLTRLSGDSRLENKSNTERVASYHDAWRVIEANSLGGAGIGNYTLALSALTPGQPSWHYQPTHDTFLLVWSEVGLIGLLLFICILVILINPEFQISMLNKIPDAEIKNNSIAKIGIWKFIGNWDLEIGNFRSDKISNNVFLKISVIVAMITMMLVDHYLWSLHFGVLFFWLIAALAVKMPARTETGQP